jgi:hypothetical protein
LDGLEPFILQNKEGRKEVLEVQQAARLGSKINNAIKLGRDEIKIRENFAAWIAIAPCLELHRKKQDHASCLFVSTKVKNMYFPVNIR